MVHIVHILVVIAAVAGGSLASPTLLADELNPLIVGGDLVQIEDYPHQVALLWGSSFICGGFIINECWVVTAAHCTSGLNNLEFFTIRAGSTFSDRGGVEYGVQANIVHPDFEWRTLEHDIALLKVVGKIEFTASVQPIPVAASGLVIEDGSDMRVSGYGDTLQPTDQLTHLRAVTVPKIHLDRCIEKYAHYPFPVTDSMICAGLTEGGKDACSGDSGSALVYEGVAVGIVSWGVGCARPSYPGVYASMAYVAEWIQAIANVC